ncbi:MAG TPA: hypothetical protein VKA68_01395 [bacterium]|nr:hypothetical protein [bacterium]
MQSYKCLPIILLISTLILAPSADGHIEGLLFQEHPPKTTAGILLQSGRYQINNNNVALSINSFAEYALSSNLSVGVGLPLGQYQDQFQLSDAVVAVKSALPLQTFTAVPMILFEVPTGMEPMTSGHTEIVPALFLEKKIPDIHLYGSIKGRAEVGESDDEHGHLNVLAPHATDELAGDAGISYWVADHIGLDARINGYYEDFESFHPGVEVGVVYQNTTRQGTTVKASLGYYTISSGVREGSGLGFSFYIAP